MPRDSNGTYTLYTPGNPVVTGTVITSTAFNNTMNDIATAITGSLARKGDGGMTGQFKAADGSVGTPGISFTAEPATGFYRAAAADVRLSIAGTSRYTFSASQFRATAIELLSGGNIGGWDATAAYTIGSNPLTGVTTGGFIQLYGSANATPSSVFIGTAGITRISVNAAGNIVVGAPASGASLSVSGLNAATAVWGDFNDGTRFVRIRGSGAGRVGLFSVNSHPLDLGANDTTYLSIAVAGNVSINAPSSGACLTLPANFATNYGGNRFMAGDGSANHYVYTGSTAFHIRNQGDTANRITVGDDGLTYITKSSGTALGVGFTTGATGRALETSGQVGMFESTARAAVTDFNWSGTTFSIGPFTATGSALDLRTCPSGGATASRLSISSTGNVTINAPSSGASLTVNAVANGTAVNAVSPNANVYFQLGNTTDVNGYLAYEGSEISLYSANTKRLAISSAGNVSARGVAICAVKAADTARSSTITLTADPDLVTPVLAIGRYAINCWIRFNNPAGGAGFQFNFGTSGTATMDRAQTGYVNAATYALANTVGRTSATQFATVTTLTAGDWVQIQGMLNVTVAGTISVDWAQQTSSANATQLLQGSYIQFTRLN